MRPGVRAGSGTQRRRGSVRLEQPERAGTMSFSIGPTESQRPNRAADTARPSRTDTGSARPQQDARGKEGAGGTAEHFPGEHRPPLEW